MPSVSNLQRDAEYKTFEDFVNSLGKRELKQLCRELGSAVTELQWMARRYADNRQTAAPGIVNDITARMVELAIEPHVGVEGVIWAQDGGGRRFDALTDEQLKPGTPAATGAFVPLPRGFRLADELEKELGKDPVKALQKILELKRRAAMSDESLAEEALGKLQKKERKSV